MANWFLLLPPEGGARQVATNLLNAFKQKIPAKALHFFDCKKYYSGFNTMLKNPEENMIVDLLNQSLIVQCIQYEITHLLVPALCPVTLFTLNLLKKQKITTIHWFVEDYRRANYWKDILPGYSWFLAVQKGYVQEECRKNNCRFAYLPTAPSEESVTFKRQDNNLKRKIDIGFVGFPTPYRIEFLEYLLSQDISLTIAGEGWDGYRGPLSDSIITGKWIDPQQAVQIMDSASLAINLSYEKPSGDLYDIQISPRVYDILSIGTTLLTEDVPLLHETIGDCHFYTFKNKEEATEKIHPIISDLDNENIKNKIENNRGVILQNHTWEKRAEQILELCS